MLLKLVVKVLSLYIKGSNPRAAGVFHYLLLSFLLLNTLLFSESALPKALVSVAPYRYFVEKLASGMVETELLVPEGTSAHTFEPTAKQMIGASKAILWFRIGEPFETKAIDAIKSVNPEMQLVDLREGIPLLHGSCRHVHAGGHCGDDLHLWMSPAIAKTQSQIIAKALIDRFPEKKEVIAGRLTELLEGLTQLDSFIRTTLAPVKNRVLIVSHPAYAYFCQAYGFQQLSIEFEGRDPTAKQLTELLTNARRAKSNFILTQPQYSDKAARLIAGELKAKLISVDPYSEDYEASLRLITTLIAENS